MADYAWLWAMGRGASAVLQGFLQTCEGYPSRKVAWFGKFYRGYRLFNRYQTSWCSRAVDLPKPAAGITGADRKALSG